MSQNVFEEIKARKRSCSFAEAKVQAQSNEILTSGYGGIFWGAEGETWPMSQGDPLLPVLSVRVDELPYKPAHLDGVALINVFVHPDLDPTAANDEVIRVYSSLNGLQPLDHPAKPTEFYKIVWQLKDEFPDAGSISSVWKDEFAAYDEYDALSDMKKAEISNHYGTKVGGWPNHLQDNILTYDDTPFIFQLDETEVFSFLDGGIGYFFKQDDEFYMLWESS